MSAAIRVQRVDEHLAVQYTPGDEEAEAVLRGWLQLPVYAVIPSSLPEGYWVVFNKNENKFYLVSPTEFAKDFMRVIEG